MILVASDIHSNNLVFAKILEREEFEAIFVCGDITDFRGEDVLSFERVVKEYEVPCFDVHGNCDDNLAIKLLESSEVITFLHGRSVEFNGFLIHGVGGSNRTPFYTPSEYSEEYIESVLKRFNISGNDILLAHCPPYGILDRTYEGIHAGSTSIAMHVKKFQFVFCGHIHEAKGVERVKNTILVNPGSTASGNYALVDLEKSEVYLKNVYE